MKFNPENMQSLGEGGEKKVYIHPEDEEKVVAFFREGPKSSETAASMKGRFYLTKILHLLIPDSVPDIHLATRNDDEAVLVSERKHLGDEYSKFSRLNDLNLQNTLPSNELYKLSNAESEHAYTLDQDAMDSLYSKLDELGVLIDFSTPNLGNDSDNNLIYVDNSFRPWRYSQKENLYGEKSINKFYSPKNIRKQAEKLSEQDRDKVLAYLDRLEALYDEENGAG